jgi:hypothetical protein
MCLWVADERYSLVVWSIHEFRLRLYLVFSASVVVYLLFQLLWIMTCYFSGHWKFSRWLAFRLRPLNNENNNNISARRVYTAGKWHHFSIAFITAELRFHQGRASACKGIVRFHQYQLLGIDTLAIESQWPGHVITEDYCHGMSWRVI